MYLQFISLICFSPHPHTHRTRQSSAPPMLPRDAVASPRLMDPHHHRIPSAILIPPLVPTKKTTTPIKRRLPEPLILPFSLLLVFSFTLIDIVHYSPSVLSPRSLSASHEPPLRRAPSAPSPHRSTTITVDRVNKDRKNKKTRRVFICIFVLLIMLAVAAGVSLFVIWKIQQHSVLDVPGNLVVQSNAEFVIYIGIHLVSPH